jgi:hypothetical protein
MHHKKSIAFVEKETIEQYLNPFIEIAPYQKHITGLPKKVYFTPIGLVDAFTASEKAALHRSGYHFLGQVLLQDNEELATYNGTFAELLKKIREYQKRYRLSARLRSSHTDLRRKFRDQPIGAVFSDMGIFYWFAYQFGIGVLFTAETKIGDQSYRAFLRYHAKQKDLSLLLRKLSVSHFHMWIETQ